MSTFFTMIGSAARTALTRRPLALGVAGAVIATGTSMASAHEHHPHLDLGIAVAPVEHVEPIFEDREVRVWVPAVYRATVEHVWVEPVYRATVERVWVPEVVEVRDVRHGDGLRARLTRERVLVSPGHYEDRSAQELVSPGHFEDVERQELVCDGHYDVHVEHVKVAERHEPGIELPGVAVRIRR